MKMTEISLWHAGDEKIRVLHTTEDVDVVSETDEHTLSSTTTCSTQITRPATERYLSLPIF